MPDDALPFDAVDPGREPPAPLLDVLPVEPVVVSVIRPPRPGFWGALLWTFVYGGAVQLVIGTAMGIVAFIVQAARSDDPAAFVSKFQTPGFQQTAEFRDMLLLGQALSLGVLPVAGALLAFGLIRWTAGKTWRRRLALCRPGMVQVILTVLGLPALVYLSDGAYRLAVLAHLPTFNYQQELLELFAKLPVWFSVLTVGLGAPLAEELFCRGFLGRGLVARYGRIGGVLLTSLFFSVMHLDPPHIVGTFVIGLCLHYTYLTTRSLWMPILLHFLNNSLSVLSVTLLKHNAIAESIDQPALFMYAPALLLAVAVGWALYRSRARLVPAPDAQEPRWQPRFPGVEYPPPQSGTLVVRPWPGLPSLICVTLAFLIFTTALLLPISK
jgi:membrane protease YdiL (CAAX protease family)